MIKIKYKNFFCSFKLQPTPANKPPQFNMLIAAKCIGAGVSTVGVCGADVGIGVVFGCYLIALSRNPSLEKEMFVYAFLGFALSEATALFALMVSFLILLYGV